ncbi:MAG: choice-of-anchor L domain-containing protein [Bacteroidales bacterium]|nr:choice-of-anchor L domain-containing protein [Bacteroidales bacterium]
MSLNLYSQFTIYNFQAATNANTLVNALVGTGVQYFNPTFTGSYQGTNSGNAGFFINGAQALGIDKGIVLTTGQAGQWWYDPNKFLASANSYCYFSTDNGLGGDALLTSIAGSQTYNAAVLTFEFIPESNYIQFRYVFGSDEYDEYVGDIYNDIFGFFVTSLEADGYNYNNLNIAKIPGTSTPITINNVNKGNSACGSPPGGCTNCAYYISNVPTIRQVEYDGLTTVLTAGCQVTPCKRYRMKIAIADVGDPWYDSGVFLEENSFISPVLDDVTISFSNANAGGGTNAVEGCSNAIITFALNFPTPINRNINFTLGGTAQFGVDYYTIPDISGSYSPPNNYYVTIPQGQQSITLTIVPILDGTNEGTESINYSIQTHLCDPSSIVTGAINIIDNSTPFSLSLQPSYNICLGQSQTISVTVNGGQQPLNFQWNTGQNTNPITVNPGYTTTYVVTVTEACGATSTAQTTVIVNPVPSVFASPSSLTICSGNTTNITISSNVSSSQFTWTASGSNNASGYSSGTGNTIQQTLITTNNNPASVIYTIQATANGCNSSPINLNVTINPSPIINNITTTPVTVCQGTPDGTITISAAGGTPPYQYSLNGGPFQSSNTFTNLPATVYNVVVKDANGCQAIQNNITISGATGLTIDSIVTTNVTCYGGSNGSITIYSAGATQFSINNGQTYSSTNIFTGLSAGFYPVVVKDAGNCQAAGYVQINQPPDINATIITHDQVCDSLGNIIIHITGGTPPYSLLWNNGSTDSVLNNLYGGIYSVTVTDANGCTKTFNAQINSIGTPVIDSVIYADAKCFGVNNGYILIYASNATMYSIDNGNTWSSSSSFYNLPAGQYIILVKNNLNCISSDTITLLAPQDISVNIQTTPETCLIPGTASVTPFGGTPPYTYQWSSGETTNTITQIHGTYTVTITDVNGCTKVFNATIAYQGSTPVVTYQATNIKCYGEMSGSIILNVSNVQPPYHIFWSHTNDTNAIQTNLPAGVYYVTVVDNFGCSAVNTIVLGQPSQIEATFTIKPKECSYDTLNYIVMNVNGGMPPYHYKWSNGDTLHYLLNVPDGNYFVTVTDSYQCSRVYGPFIFITPPKLEATTVVQNPKCYNEKTGTISISVSGGTVPYKFYWSTGDTLPQASNLGEGVYFVTVIDKNNCMLIVSDSIKYPPNMAVTGQVDIIDNRYGTINIDVYGGTPPFTYQWSNGMTTEDVSNLGGGNYFVTVTDYNGCKVTAVFFVDISLKIPNVITPNNDNINDDFEIIGIQAFEKVIIEIFDRWGNNVFEFNGKGIEYVDKTKRWNGKFKGNDLPSGPYLYIIYLDNLAPIKGYVSIIY